MKLLDALRIVEDFGQPVLETVDAAAIWGVSNGHASKILARLAESGHAVGLRRGLWGFPEKLDPLALPERLTAPQPAYVSLQSALYYHGMLSQIPAAIYAISLARTRRYVTPLGTVSVHHVAPEFFFGFEAVGASGISLALPEKALLDYFYLHPARTRLFSRLPEVEKPASFDLGVARHMLNRIAFPARRRMVASLLEEWVERSE